MLGPRMSELLPDQTLTLPPLFREEPVVIGIGSPLVDLVLRVEESFLVDHVRGAKGGMEFIDPESISRLIQLSGQNPIRSPGGSAANITVGLANLGIPSAFIGQIGIDDFGSFYSGALIEQHCQPRLVDHTILPTGRVLALVTPDGERTMRTCLGAAAALDAQQLAPATFLGAKLVVVEGYSLFNHELARAIVRNARAAGCAVALDLAAFEVVQANREIIEELFAIGVDLVFANQDEARAWNPASPESAIDELAVKAKVAAVKLGKDGAHIARGSERIRVASEPVVPIDTIGAGDCWAAGFLAAWLRGLPLDVCGRLSCRCGAAVVQVQGAQLPRDHWLHLKGRLDAWH
jgi:sugar/nucleoside kinase (ribokinase family)